MQYHDTLRLMVLSVRTRLREGHPDFAVTADSWPAFLFPNARSNAENIEAGLFRSAIMLKVFVPNRLTFQRLIYHFRLLSLFLPPPHLRRTLSARKM
jgi:hypothetical protein